jgi:predicted house-cleaning noncanonical NTP pyrophosphatase (MazG superfamily)|tara:strand:- start:35768 stop:36697 length:930 start_codon:yes stop_codon:yes gene_type:complete
MKTPPLLTFLEHHMAMTDVYQPAIVKELLIHGGRRTKAELASALVRYDRSVQKHYERVVMRWPKITLSKHGIVTYERRGGVFQLLSYPENAEIKVDALRLCDEKIDAWLRKKAAIDKAPEAGVSARYAILKAANGKCELCGISSEIRSLDVDHIVPVSKADKNGDVVLHGVKMDVNDTKNLQALCFSCNRAKGNSDRTDFRRQETLVRGKVSECTRTDGEIPVVTQKEGSALSEALYDKLVEVHADLLAAENASNKCAVLVDLIEVTVALAEHYGTSESQLMEVVNSKRDEQGTFTGRYIQAVNANEKQ